MDKLAQINDVLAETDQTADLTLQIRDEAVNWLVELARREEGGYNIDTDRYTRLHDAIRDSMDLQRFAATIAADPELADVLWPVL
jgi:predicted Ser/Thr protein kinase